jgi:hypothetical protein
MPAPQTVKAPTPLDVAAHALGNPALPKSIEYA